jgi:hypothetical protein
VGWKKLGLLLEATGQTAWMATHAALPIVDTSVDPPRLYFTSRNAQGRSHIGMATLELGSNPRVVDVHPAAVLAPGSRGAFDDAGVTGSCLVHHERGLRLYYTGWSLGVSVPFYLAAGQADSRDGGTTFQRGSAAPLLDRSTEDPYLTASPWVMVNDGRWMMWYVSGTEWSVVDGQPRHHYLIKYAESADGRRWERSGRICIPYRDAGEYAFGRPCVLHEDGRFRMWFSSRGDRYQLGYAESPDGTSWIRDDAKAGLRSSSDGWDSEMVTYPLVFRYRGRLHMLYNGNGYGRSGLGIAMEE